MKAVVIALLCLFVVACSKKDDTPSTPQVVPLKTGNTWTYNNVQYNTDGTPRVTSSLKLVVAGTVQANGQTYYAIVDAANAGDTIFLIRSDEQSAYVFSRSLNKEALLFKEGATNGEKLFSSELIPGTRIERVATTEQVTIGGIAASKIVDSIYTNQALKYYSLLYFKKDIGFMGSADYIKNPSNALFYKQNERQLVSYNLKY